MFNSRLLRLAASCLVLAIFGLGTGVDTAAASGNELVVTEEDFTDERVYSPYAGRAYPDQVFFGDMHFHTNLSFDAGLDRDVVGRRTMATGWLAARRSSPTPVNRSSSSGRWTFWSSPTTPR